MSQASGNHFYRLPTTDYGSKTKTKTVKDKGTKKPAYHYSNIRFVLTCIAAIFVLFLSATNIMLYFYKKDVLGLQKDIEAEKSFWSGVTEKNPTYPDGWLKLATLEWELGNEKASYEAYLKAKSLNPQSPNVENVAILFGE